MNTMTMFADPGGWRKKRSRDFASFGMTDAQIIAKTWVWLRDSYNKPIAEHQPS
jgi:hypothetical protein